MLLAAGKLARRPGRKVQKPDERANTLAKGWARSIVPAVVRRTNQAYWDTTMRETRGPLDALKANVPGWSDTLPPHPARSPATKIALVMNCDWFVLVVVLITETAWEPPSVTYRRLPSGLIAI